MGSEMCIRDSNPNIDGCLTARRLELNRDRRRRRGRLAVRTESGPPDLNCPERERFGRISINFTQFQLFASPSYLSSEPRGLIKVRAAGARTKRIRSRPLLCEAGEQTSPAASRASHVSRCGEVAAATYDCLYTVAAAVDLAAASTLSPSSLLLCTSPSTPPRLMLPSSMARSEPRCRRRHPTPSDNSSSLT